MIGASGEASPSGVAIADPVSSGIAPSGRVETVQSLRALAALSVLLFHFSLAAPKLYFPPVLKTPLKVPPPQTIILFPVQIAV